MTHPTQGFSTPHARDLWGMGLDFMLDAHPDGRMHAFTTRPTTLPTASPKVVQDELARLSKLHRHEYRGRPAEL
jgi:hypothetical protein